MIYLSITSLIAAAFAIALVILSVPVTLRRIATSICGFRDVIRVSHESFGMELRPIQFNCDIAPIISNQRITPSLPAIRGHMEFRSATNSDRLRSIRPLPVA
jgi:hypothetical protein